VSCGGQPGCDVLAGGVAGFTPGAGEGGPAGKFAGERGAERCQPWGEYPAVGFGEQDGDRAAAWCEPVAVGAGEPLDDLFAPQPPQVIGRVPAGVGGAEQRGGELGQGPVVESGDQVGEPQRGGQDGHDAGVAEAQCRGVQAIGGGGGPGHLGGGDGAGGGLGVCGFSVTQTLAGVFASGPQGIPVVQADAPPDPEVPGVADDGLGPQCPVRLEVLPNPAGLVVAADLRADSLGDDLGAERAGGFEVTRRPDVSDTRSGRPASRWSRISPSKNARPAAGRSNTSVPATSN
jgi:hypothetical protein